MLQGARILVTGATGFIGRQLASRLTDAGADVCALVRATSVVDGLANDVDDIYRTELTAGPDLQAAVKNADIVYHLAAKTSATTFEELLSVNGHGTSAVVNACLTAHKPPLFIYVSSIAAAGPATRGRIRLASDLPVPISNYGRSKRAGEVAVARASNRLPAVIIRPGIVFGENNRELLPIFKSIQQFGVHAVSGMYSPELSLIHVNDLIEILCLLPERAKRLTPAENQGLYFACVPEYPTYDCLGKLVARGLDRSHLTRLYLPDPLPWVVGLLGDLYGRLSGKMESLNVDKIREARAESWACSSDELIEDLDYEFPKPLMQQLKDTALWYQQQSWI